MVRRFPRSPTILLFSMVLTVIMALIISVIVSIIIWSNPVALLKAFLSFEVGYAVSLSLLTSFASTSLSVLAAIPISYLLSRYEFRGKTLVETFLMLPFAMPPVALGISLLMFFTSTQIGAILNNILNIVFEVPGLVAAQFAVITPIIIKILKTGFDGIDVKYEGVARTLGYSQLSAIAKIILPMMRNSVAAAYILGFTRALGEFGASVTLAGATKLKTETLPIALYLTLSSGDIEMTAALLIVCVAVAATSITALNLSAGRSSVTVI